VRALVQRVHRADVAAGEATVGRIGRGLLVYLGVGRADTEAEARRLAEKIATLRIFEDEQDKLNLSVRDVGGAVLVIPNFTLLADTRKGRRPAFAAAADASAARPLHEAFVDALKQAGCEVECGVFGACMTICSDADGPVNVIAEMPPGN
jgi:D-tyrosyl-tRNA(Tyr) deacylase